MTTTDNLNTSSIRDITKALGGSIKEFSLMLIEGETRTTGKACWASTSPTAS